MNRYRFTVYVILLIYANAKLFYAEASSITRRQYAHPIN
jgi:hypothetical protein